MTIRDKPAFPRPFSEYSSSHNGVEAYKGMTLREFYAGLAMAGMRVHKRVGDLGYVEVADFAVKQADALIAELEKEK